MKRIIAIALILPWLASGATFGTAVGVVGGATDLVLDEARGRLYVIDNTQNRVDVYHAAQRRLLTSIPVSPQPLSGAMSRDGKRLYVTSYGASSLDVIDLDQNVVVRRVSLPAAPEGVAVGGDERVLITTVGSGTNNADNRLLLFDPAAASEPLRTVSTTLPAPAPPQTPLPSSRVFMSTRSNLAASADGQIIIGLNNPNTTTRQLFVFEVASGTVLRSRSLTSISNVLSVSADGSRFMAGLSLFESDTLAIVAQQNTANSLHPFDTTANFNTQQNQGGSVFAPDGSALYAAFNIAPVQNPAARANVTQLLISDPRNLLIRTAIQLPENLTGNMIISANGDTIYGLSQSGFLVIPIGAMNDSPVAVVEQLAVSLVNDQCGVFENQAKFEVKVRNAGKGRMTVTAQVQQAGPTFTAGLGGQGGPGGGAPGAGLPILLPVGPGQIGGGIITLPTAPTTTTTQQAAVTQTAPSVTAKRTDTETIFEFKFNSNAARSLGTTAPVDFLIQSPEAINVPARIRVFQNNRNAEAKGIIRPVDVSISTAEALVDMVHDTARQRLYIANSGMNRVEVFDIFTGTFLTPIVVGQLPRSLALTPNGKTLYVANSGGESISIVDVETLTLAGKVKFPPVPYNAGFSLVTPSVIAATLSGVQIVMSDGSLWRVVNNEALPRPVSAVIGSSTVTAPRTMAASPGGEYAILLGGTGTAYLFDAMSDEYVLSQSVASNPIQGYFGPLAAGPRGQYFLVNGQVLNSTLTPVAGATTGSRPIAAVAAVNANQVARFTTPLITNTTAAIRDIPQVELLDAATGLPRGNTTVLEGPLATQTGTQRVNVNGRTMAVDAASNIAYVLTASGLMISPLNAAAQGGPGGVGGAGSTNPTVTQSGIVNTATLRSGLAPGGLISIFGQNLASPGAVSGGALPTRLGGVCVTLDESPLPLLMTSASQLNLQLPATIKTGKHTVVIRAFERNASSGSFSIDVAKYAPAVIINDQTKQAAIYHADGTAVTNSKEANRDEALTLYAAGLGVTSTAGETDKVQVYFGDPRMKQSEMIVEASQLAPGLIGVYRIDVRVPGFRTTGDSLPVMLRIGGIDSPTTGDTIPTTAVK